MNINELTLGQLKEISQLVNCGNSTQSFIDIGKNYLIRTVTMIYTGKIIKESNDAFLLSSAAWIPDTGRWADNLISCSFNEVEPYPENKNVIVYKSGILDIVEIEKLPVKQK